MNRSTIHAATMNTQCPSEHNARSTSGHHRCMWLQLQIAVSVGHCRNRTRLCATTSDHSVERSVRESAALSVQRQRQRSASSCCRWKIRSPDVASSTGLPARAVHGAVELGLPRAKVLVTAPVIPAVAPGLERYSAMGGVSGDLTAPNPSPTWSPGAR